MSEHAARPERAAARGEPAVGRIQTVLGPIDPSEAGVTMGHEHVLFDAWEMFRSYDVILDDETLMARELARLAEAGGRTVVDCTNIGLGRQPEGLARVSVASGVNIVMGSGWYRSAVHPPYIRECDADELAEMVVADLLGGADGTAVRAGFIGEIGTERGRIAAAEERVFRAAARAQRRTGVSIWTHTTNAGELALEQIELLASEGVPPGRIVVSHVGDRFSFDLLGRIAATGVFLSIDNIGYTDGGYPPDAVRADNVVRLVEAGHAGRVLLSGDTCTRGQLTAYGGPGYARVLTSFLPLLRERGLGEQVIRSMLVDAPARALTIEPPAAA
jgi:predicted metal-dependent phosphotriesterase family hydrolase